jgi:hypothetical protein
MQKTNYTVAMTADQVEILVSINLASADLPSKRYGTKRVIVYKDYFKLLRISIETSTRILLSLSCFKISMEEGKRGGADSKQTYNDIALLEIDGRLRSISLFVLCILHRRISTFDPSCFLNYIQRKRIRKIEGF